MAASYPGAIKSFTTKVDSVDDVLASHVNDLQLEVTAIETELGINATQKLIKAWAHFTTSGGTVTLADSNNISSIGDRGVGMFTANFTTAFASANYAWSGSCRETASTTTAGIGSSSTESAQTTTACQFICQYWTGGTLVDPDRCSFMATGDQ